MITPTQSDNISEWEKVNGCDYIYFIFCGPDG